MIEKAEVASLDIEDLNHTTNALDLIDIQSTPLKDNRMHTLLKGTWDIYIN